MTNLYGINTSWKLKMRREDRKILYLKVRSCILDKKMTLNNIKLYLNLNKSLLLKSVEVLKRAQLISENDVQMTRGVFTNHYDIPLYPNDIKELSRSL
jgi:hypothetical protein